MKIEPREIAAVLLVPAEGDPHRLLAEGLCGTRPPMANACLGGVCWVPGTDSSKVWRSRYRSAFPTALALAWRGNPIPEGMDRAMRRLESVTEGDDDRGLPAYDLWWSSLGIAINLADACERHGLGKAVHLDRFNKDVRG